MEIAAPRSGTPSRSSVVLRSAKCDAGVRVAVPGSVYGESTISGTWQRRRRECGTQRSPCGLSGGPSSQVMKIAVEPSR